MLFSIITPVYNEEKYITQCIESVLNQTYANFELILVDDGSTDNCVQIMDDYAKKDARVKVHHQENQGPIAAKDKAISLATGEYCVFLDSDDYFEPILLETVYEAIKRTNCDLCMYKWYNVDEKGKFTIEGVFEHNTFFDKDNMHEFYKKLITVNELNSVWIKAIRADILKSIKRDPNFLWIRREEDLYISLQIFTRAESILYLDVPLYNYRTTNRESMTKKFDPTIFKSSTAVRKEVFRHLGIWGIDDEQSKTTFYNWFVKNAFRLMKGSFMLGISRKEKLVLLREMVQDDFFNDALRKVDKSYYSKLDRIEIFLFKHKLVVLLYLFNTMIFNRYAAKPLIERKEMRKRNA
ncbi:MAG TPA: glycosyltransferase family 2 protein [Clostridia bacterium]|nr:glycosyltransferase family 2 protein [Clostridia bacterium]HPZ52422.1 glycosyltransferase family 2 protein [Clostridia bacterium]